MEKFRKRPVVIEAQQITAGDFDNDHPNDNHIVGVVYDPLARQVLVQTLEGMMVGCEGDWIIRGVKGELYPCRADIFALTYEPADFQPEPMVPLRLVEEIRCHLDTPAEPSLGPMPLRAIIAHQSSLLNVAKVLLDAAIRAAREGAR